MRRDRIEAELPPQMISWLRNNGTDDTWERVARDLAVALGAQLLVSDGEGGWGEPLHDALLADASPTVRYVAAQLGCDPSGRRWSARQVTKAVCRYLELWVGGYEVGRRLPHAA